MMSKFDQLLMKFIIALMFVMLAGFWVKIILL
jgi:hypothetical protein